MNNRILALVVILFVLSIVAVAAIVLAVKYSHDARNGKQDCTTAPITEKTPTSPWGHSKVGQYRYAAVATDTDICSKIGTDVLGHLGGSAVDAAVAAMLCVGVVNMHSAGIGGGHFMTIYDTPRGQQDKILTTILAREVAPGAASRDMYVNDTDASKYGGLAVGVPGEIAGMYTAWEKFGRVDWPRLVAPSIHICRDGFKVGHALAIAVSRHADFIHSDPNMAAVLVKQDGSLVTEGDIVKLPKLARTFERIGDDPMSFYNGSLADDILADLHEYDSIITADDLVNFVPKEKQPFQMALENGNYTAYSPRPPSGGAALQFILKILDGYKLDPSSAEPENKSETYQRIVEAFKFAFGLRSALGDEDFVDVEQVLANVTSHDYAEAIRHRINDTNTQDLPFYGPTFDIMLDQGTAHLSIVAPDGSAVSMTSTINYNFGAKICGKRTGIIFNDEMHDFSTPGIVNSYDVSASPSNYIEPGKMPMSSMSPTLILDQQGKVVFVAGASGGTRIITATALVMINSLWLGQSLQAAIDTARVHHKLLPNTLTVEPHIDQDVLRVLQSYGHKTEMEPKPLGMVQAIHNKCEECMDGSCLGEPCIHAACDSRKGGVPDGF